MRALFQHISQRLFINLRAFTYGKLFLTGIFFFICQVEFSQTVGDYRSKASSDWTTLATWERYDGSIWVEPTAGEGYPGQFGQPNVTIRSTYVVNQNSGPTINDLIIESNAQLVHPLMNHITIYGNYTNNGIHQNNGVSYIYLRSLSGPKTIDGSGTVINFTRFRIYDENRTFPGSCNLTINGDIQIATNGLTTTNNGVLTVTGSITESGIGVNSTWINGSDATLNIGGSLTGLNSFNASANGNLVNFNGNINQIVPGTTYFHLTTSTSSTKTLGGNIAINGDLNIGAGTTLDVGNGFNYGITIQGNWVHSMTGTFNERSGTVTFFGNNVQSITGNLDETFYNLTINKTGGYAQQITGSNFTITNNLFVSNGTLDLGTTVTTSTVGGTATINGTLNYNGTAAKTITISNNLSGTGIIDMSGGNLAHELKLGGATNNIGTLISGTSSVVDYIRNGNQTVIGSNNYRHLNISGSGTKTMSSNITAAGILTMSSGNINCGGNTLTLSNAAPGAIVYSAGTIIGKLQRAIGSTGSNFLYPVGTALSYNPAKIIFNNLSAGSLLMEYRAGDIGNAGLVPALNDNGVEIYDRYTTGYWALTPISGLASSDYDISLNYTGFTGVNIASRVLKRNSGGNLTTDGIHGSVASPEISRIGLNGISAGITDFAICMGQPHISKQPSDTAICPGFNVEFVVEATGQATLNYQWQANTGSGFTDIINGGVYSGVATDALSISGATLGMNGYSYRCVITDGGGNEINSNSALLTVEDNEDPVSSCAVSGNQPVTTNNACTYVHGDNTWNGTATDNCASAGSIGISYQLFGVTTDTVANLNGQAFNLGTTWVRMIVVDVAGNIDSCSFTVTVSDDDDPVINTCVANKDVILDASCNFTLPDYTGDAALSITECSTYEVTQSPAANTVISDTTTVTLTVTDEYGNTATCSFDVNTIDNTDPIINTCVANKDVILDASCNFTLPDYTADAALKHHRMQHLRSNPKSHSRNHHQ